jgi:hypothetical protein
MSQGGAPQPGGFGPGYDGVGGGGVGVGVGDGGSTMLSSNDSVIFVSQTDNVTPYSNNSHNYDINPANQLSDHRSGAFNRDTAHNNTAARTIADIDGIDNNGDHNDEDNDDDDGFTSSANRCRYHQQHQHFTILATIYFID